MEYLPLVGAPYATGHTHRWLPLFASWLNAALTSQITTVARLKADRRWSLYG